MLHVEKSLRLDLPWEALEGMLKGISAIDMNRMTVKDYDEAGLFVQNYGYDLSSSKDRAEVAAIQEEAISFIERRLLDPATDWEALGAEPLDARIPDTLKDCDVRQLLIVAATQSGMDQRWACAILKVMHTITHINNTLLYRYFEQARSQILSRFYSALTHQDSGDILLGNASDLHLSIAGFEVKDEKSRDSMILKLLCKRENVAEEVFDMIGVRIITYTPAQAIMALEILRRDKVVLFPNIIPSRSRNSLIDLDDFKVQFLEAIDEFRWGAINMPETLRLISTIATESPDESFNPENPFTHSDYRSIHITGRQLIRFTSPGSEEETRFFFPYEIQIVDEANYIQNLAGSSAHSRYKQNQLIQARRRVLGPLFITLRKQHRRADKGLEPEPLS